METVLGVIIVIDAYAIIYYRLLVKYYYEKENKVKESALGAILSFPPHRKLPTNGKRYAKRYWIAISVLIICIIILLPGRDFSAIFNQFNNTQTS